MRNLPLAIQDHTFERETRDWQRIVRRLSPGVTNLHNVMQMPRSTGACSGNEPGELSSARHIGASPFAIALADTEDDKRR